MATPVAIQMGLMPGFALQDGDLLARLIWHSGSWGAGGTANVAVTAAGNNSFDNAAPLTSSINVVSTATATANSVMLPNVAPGGVIRIYSTVATPINVFPPDEAQRIDGSAVGVAATLTGPDTGCDYTYVGSNQWISNMLGDTSA